MKEYPYSYSVDQPPAAVSEIPFFQELSSDAIREMLKGTTILECAPGDRIVAEGEVDQSLIFLLKGKVRVIKDGTNVAAAWKSGDILGELSALNEEGRTASIVADTPTYCLKVDPMFLENLPDGERAAYLAAMYRFLAKLLADRLADTTEKLARAEQLLSERGG